MELIALVIIGLIIFKGVLNNITKSANMLSEVLPDEAEFYRDQRRNEIANARSEWEVKVKAKK